jgi:hypothetical protein
MPKGEKLNLDMKNDTNEQDKIFSKCITKEDVIHALEHQEVLSR